ncbi:helix-turn-helix domain-containing protein [Fredinandcohnia humi]
MSGNKRITDIELAKIIMDPRRRNIIDIASKGPITVAQMAEALNEKQSRLYYHVKKLEEAGLLTLVETRQHGNLIEKYYQAPQQFSGFELDKTLLSEHSDTVLQQIMNIIEPGLKMLSTEIKNSSESDYYEKQVSVTINFSEMTGKEWLESTNRMLKAMKNRKTQIVPQNENENEPQFKLTPEQLKEKSKYAYVILSYRVDDVEGE